MLIEFSVENFRSIKDRQTLSMVASARDQSLPNHLIDPQTPGLSKTKLLKSAAIYGANASGKSNIFKAAKFMRDFVVKSATEIKPGQETGVVPFRLDSQTEKKPSEFEMIFIHEGVRYQYGFSLDKKRVHEEWLIAYPVGKPQQWFSRMWNPEKGEYEWKFSTKLIGEKKSLKNKIRENTLYISVAAQLNNKQANLIYEYFRDYIVFIDGSGEFPNPAFSAFLIEKVESLKKLLAVLIQEADLGVTGFDYHRITKDDIQFPDTDDPSIKQKLLNEIEEKSVYDIRLRHKCIENGREILFSYEDESEGTWKFFSVVSVFLYCLSHGFTVFVDEIGAQMHPLLVTKLQEMFSKLLWNPKNAQLIFTTHDTTQLNTNTLRRDQVWFTEKDKAGATFLYPLTDFQPRSDESLQKGYLAGRYGAIPFLGEFTFK